MKSLLNRKAFLILLLMSILVFSACSGLNAETVDKASEAAYEQAVADGLIAEAARDSAGNDAIYDMATVEIKNVSRESMITAKFHIPAQRSLTFKRDYGRLKGVYVEPGQRVNKDDVLAEIIFDQAELQTEREQFMIKFRQFEQRFINDDDAWKNNIAKQRDSFSNDMDEAEAEIHQLKLMKMELEYERFLYNSERAREDYQKQLKEIDERLEGEQILAPYDGIISYTNSSKNGTLIRNWMRMATIIDDSEVQIIMTGPIDILRFGDVFEAQSSRNEDLNFTVRVVSDPIVQENRLGQYDYLAEPVDLAQLRSVAEASASTLVAFYNLSFTVNPVAFEMNNVLVVPRDAVKQEDQKNFVYIYEDGTMKKRYVQTGLLLFAEIQIISGLEAGQVVLITP